MRRQPVGDDSLAPGFHPSAEKEFLYPPETRKSCCARPVLPRKPSRLRHSVCCLLFLYHRLCPYPFPCPCSSLFPRASRDGRPLLPPLDVHTDYVCAQKRSGCRPAKISDPRFHPATK